MRVGVGPSKELLLDGVHVSQESLIKTSFYIAMLLLKFSGLKLFLIIGITRYCFSISSVLILLHKRLTSIVLTKSIHYLSI